MEEDVLERIISEVMAQSGDEPRIFCSQGDSREFTENLQFFPLSESAFPSVHSSSG
jgi:hypothetical protein